jgi:hypothetical protein
LLLLCQGAGWTHSSPLCVPEHRRIEVQRSFQWRGAMSETVDGDRCTVTWLTLRYPTTSIAESLTGWIMMIASVISWRPKLGAAHDEEFGG